MMDSAAVIGALGALAQEHRLAAFRLLVQAGDEGMPAGAIAEALGVPNSSLSFHLAQLTRAGLIRQERQSRRSEEHTSELQSLMRISYAVFCLKKKKTTKTE